MDQWCRKLPPTNYDTSRGCLNSKLLFYFCEWDSNPGPVLPEVTTPPTMPPTISMPRPDSLVSLLLVDNLFGVEGLLSFYVKSRRHLRCKIKAKICSNAF